MAKNHIFALIALVAWSGSDLFSKKGTIQKDKYSHWRVIFAVGAIMGLHAVITLIVSAIWGEQLLATENSFLISFFYSDFVAGDFIKYLPVAFVYLLAMVIGYAGLRYIELSISSPICNASGSLALVLIVILGAFGVFSEPASLGALEIIAVILTLSLINSAVRRLLDIELIKSVKSMMALITTKSQTSLLTMTKNITNGSQQLNI